MPRGRKRKIVEEVVPDEVRCTRKGGATWRCFERRQSGSSLCEYHYALFRLQRKPRKAKSALKPLPFKPLNYYRRRKTFQIRPGASKELQPCTPCSPPAAVIGSSSSPIQDSMNAADNSSKDRMVDSDNQNPSSVVEDPSTVSANAGTNEGAPISEGSVSAQPNLNASPSHNANSNLFQKTPSLWQAVEQLEVFGQLPQRPHFMKLQSFCPEMREGIALGLMVTYANLTDSIKKLSFDDDVAAIVEKLSCLNPLEENGFDVDRFRTRLRQLLQIRTEYMGSGSRIAWLEQQLADMETNVAPLNRVQVELAEASNEINQLKDRINMLVMERDRLLDQTVGNGHEISKLKEAISDMNRLNDLTRKEFASLLAKPL